MKNFVFKFRIFLWLILAGVVVWLLYMGVVPSGKISYVHDFTKPNYFIGKLTPKERVVETQNFASVQIIGDPVYFSLRTPRRFDKAKLILKYRQCRDTKFCVPTLPIIEAGVLVDKTIWRYDLQPIENKIINDLTMAWDAMRENETILLQRDKKYNSIDEFINNIPDRGEIALYNHDLKQEYLLSDYEPHNVGAQDFVSMQNIASLRGPYQFYTYIKNEDLDFNFVFQDLNKNKDSDSIDLHLYYDNKLIDSRHLDDDGIAVDNGEESKASELKLQLANLPEGVYKIELRVNDDIITKSITTKQSKIAFINRIWLAESGNSDMSLHSDSRGIHVQTINPASLQTIKLFSPLASSLPPQELKLEESYKQYSIKTRGDNSLLVLAKDDVIISGDGVFSFNADSLINPNFKKVNADFNADEQGINYILAEYEIPKEENATPDLPEGNSGGQGWKIAFAEFDLTKAYRENGPRLFGGANHRQSHSRNFFGRTGGAGKYSFLISIPGLRADDDPSASSGQVIDDLVEIREIVVELEGTSLREKIFKNFK